MKIFDFRLRPPYKSFTRLGIYSPACNETAPQKHHAFPAAPPEKNPWNCYWKELAAAGIRKGVAIGRQIPDDTASVSNDDVHALAVEYPDKIIPFGSLDVSRGIAAAMDELERCITAGF